MEGLLSSNLLFPLEVRPHCCIWYTFRKIMTLFLLSFYCVLHGEKLLSERCARRNGRKPLDRVEMCGGREGLSLAMK